MTSIPIQVYERGKEYPTNEYSAPELDALVDTIERLVEGVLERTPLNETFRVEVSDDDDSALSLVFETDQPVLDILRKTQVNKTPFLMTKHQVRPPQWGLSPWPDDVRVQFIDGDVKLRRETAEKLTTIGHVTRFPPELNAKVMEFIAPKNAPTPEQRARKAEAYRKMVESGPAIEAIHERRRAADAKKGGRRKTARKTRHRQTRRRR